MLKLKETKETENGIVLNVNFNASNYDNDETCKELPLPLKDRDYF